MTHRSTPRAKKLQERVLQALSVFASVPAPPEDPPWSEYERQLTDAERAYILRSPAGYSLNLEGLALWQQGIELARQSEHMLVPSIIKALEERGILLKLNSDAFGLAARLAAFEIRHKTVESWPAFALLFRKMLGEKVIPWLPALYLAAHGFSDVNREIPDLAAVLDFRNNYAG